MLMMCLAALLVMEVRARRYAWFLNNLMDIITFPTRNPRSHFGGVEVAGRCRREPAAEPLQDVALGLRLRSPGTLLEQSPRPPRGIGSAHSAPRCVMRHV